MHVKRESGVIIAVKSTVEKHWTTQWEMTPTCRTYDDSVYNNLSRARHIKSMNIYTQNNNASTLTVAAKLKTDHSSYRCHHSTVPPPFDQLSVSLNHSTLLLTNTYLYLSFHLPAFHSHTRMRVAFTPIF